MSDYERIYLQPECCADPDVGRLWCQDDGPETCPDGEKWTPYVLASELTRLQSEVERLRGRCAELELRAVDYLKTASGLAEPKERIKARIKLEDAINHCPDPMPFIRGKQAEAVEAAVHELRPGRYGPPDDPSPEFNAACEMCAEFSGYAQRLRQQAAEIDK